LLKFKNGMYNSCLHTVQSTLHINKLFISVYVCGIFTSVEKFL